MPRTANLEVAGAAGSSGPLPEQEVPLDVPKKTRLYVEQTQREREHAVDMHRVFQRDLVKMRLETARALVKVLTDGQVGCSACFRTLVVGDQRVCTQLIKLSGVKGLPVHGMDTLCSPACHSYHCLTASPHLFQLVLHCRSCSNASRIACRPALAAAVNSPMPRCVPSYAARQSKVWLS